MIMYMMSLYDNAATIESGYSVVVDMLMFVIIFTLEHTHTHTHTHTKSSANAAVMKLDGHQLGLKNIDVAISNPPKRGEEVGRKEGGEGGGGGVERDTARHTTQKQEEEKMEEGGFTKPSFVPRVVKQEVNP